MTDSSLEFPEDRDCADLCAWENEGGAAKDDMHHHYGRRIEADRSWTIYHVYTGLPASLPYGPMTGLSESVATSTMLRLNCRNEMRRVFRSSGRPFAARPASGDLCPR